MAIDPEVARRERLRQPVEATGPHAEVESAYEVQRIRIDSALFDLAVLYDADDQAGMIALHARDGWYVAKPAIYGASGNISDTKLERGNGWVAAHWEIEFKTNLDGEWRMTAELADLACSLTVPPKCDVIVDYLDR